MTRINLSRLGISRLESSFEEGIILNVLNFIGVSAGEHKWKSEKDGDEGRSPIRPVELDCRAEVHDHDQVNVQLR